MDKPRMESVDIIQKNIEALGKLFPGCVTETADAGGKPRRAVNFDLLRQMLSDGAVEGGEVYEFTWAGKRAAIAEANRPIRKTLRPCPEESRDWDAAGNLYIEGDNLEVLKLLQENYMGRVRFIYIDPPYNTGSDFIYSDDLRMSAAAYGEQAGMFDEERNVLFRENSRANPRFHSDWCSMLCQRLLLARDLLTQDGLIFISIDDNESANLRKIADEIFGGDNFVNQLVWLNNLTGRQIAGTGAAKTWESVFVYARDKENAGSLSVAVDFAKGKMPDAYKGFEKDVKTDRYGPFVVGDTLYNHNRRFNEQTRRNLVFSIFYDPETGEIATGEIGEKMPGFVEIPPHPNGDGVHKYHAWRWSRKKIAAESRDLIVLPGKNGYEIYTRIRDFKTTLLKDVITNISNGDDELRALFGGKRCFDYPKSVDLIKLLLASCTGPDDLVMDFFSGSATTAHAVMQLNAEDGGRRKFIMVQLPEPCEESSEAYKAGYKNICEIGKERIRRAGDKIRAENPLATQDLDVGFRVFKVDDSNMEDVYYAADDIDQRSLAGMVSNIKSDRTSLDLLFGCLLDWGLPLSLPYTSETIEGCTVHTYNGGDLAACFDEDVPENVIKEIARRKPRRAVFRDAGFSGSPAKINVTEIFKMLAPDTRVRVI